MNMIPRIAVACIAFVIGSAFAVEGAQCTKDTGTEGMRARMKTLNEQMDRIEATTDRAEQRRLMDLHMKQMHEGMRELRKRDMPADCRMEMMSSMMESMVRHEQVMHGDDGR